MKRLIVPAVLALVVLHAPLARAHSELVSSDPADGASLDRPPTTVSLTFNEALMPDFVRLIGTDPAGRTGDLPVSSVEGPTTTITWPASAPAGTWTVGYRVVSQDGHPIEGAITFTYAAGSPGTSAPPSSPSPATPSPPATSSPAASPASAEDSGPWLIAGIAVAIIVLAGIALALVARRRT